MTYCPRESQNLLDRCPRCGDRLQLYHEPPPRRPSHFLGCRSYPHCTYTVAYDERLHAQLERHQQQLAFVTAQLAWLTIQVEELFARTPGEERP